MSEGIVDGMGWTRANIHLESLHLVRKTTVAETHTVGPKRGGTHVGFRTSPTTTDALRHRGYTTDVSSPHVSSPLVSSSSVLRQLFVLVCQLFVSCPHVGCIHDGCLSVVPRQLFISSTARRDGTHST